MSRNINAFEDLTAKISDLDEFLTAVCLRGLRPDRVRGGMGRPRFRRISDANVKK